MLFLNDSCPFLGPECCSENCLFYLSDKGTCSFNCSRDSASSEENRLNIDWKYAKNFETLTSEFYVIDEDNNTHTLGWEYAGAFEDF